MTESPAMYSGSMKSTPAAASTRACSTNCS